MPCFFYYEEIFSSLERRLTHEDQGERYIGQFFMLNEGFTLFPFFEIGGNSESKGSGDLLEGEEHKVVGTCCVNKWVGYLSKYSSDEFEAGDYKWILSIYPNGDETRDGRDHISASLALADTSTLPNGFEINAIFNIFVYNQVKDKYFSIPEGKVSRFRATKTECGIGRFITKEAFTDPSNGYLIDDTCLSVIKEVTNKHTWKISSFSSLTNEYYESLSFVVGDYKWRIRLYPRGIGISEDNSVSVFMALDDSTLPPDTKLFVRYILRIMNQINEKHYSVRADHQFSRRTFVNDFGVFRRISHWLN
ncbi:uncharacterized protein LOC132309110 [Cornus florida]|uniref:uncharacterized protein LOC132309110 n=1 Tax=Cornus florida TaxID=4283 RepID=UPI002898F531|nr:uncharacterized protein LOC132309110 [Cornus florida]